MAAASGLLIRGGETGELHQGGCSYLPDPPALSQQVKALEDELGTRLLERLGKRRLKLTVAGEKLWPVSRGFGPNGRRSRRSCAVLMGGLRVR